MQSVIKPIRGHTSARPRQLIFALTLVSMVAIATSHAVRAEPVEPPMELLYSPGTVLVAGVVSDIDPAGRVVFQRKDVFSGRGKLPDLIDIRVPLSVARRVKPGERYIVGYSIARSDPRHPTRTVADPRGATLVTSIGLDPALFADTPETRALLKAGRSEHGRESRRFFQLLMKALGSHDLALQTLAAGEIALEPEIGERLRDDNEGTVERVARSTQTPPAVRASLLQSAFKRPSDLGNWWEAVARDVVTTTSVGGYSDPTSDPTDLVLVALELLDQHAGSLPSDALVRWVRSGSPALVERACLMLRRISPALERTSVRTALDDPGLPDQTRRFLGDHLRRLDVLDARLKARAGGSTGS
ncbi:MAG: hypothetical protein ABIR62_17765 [Dokdonella sp.]|uniref:hypothetical protein n=1 Tax=Dokdonella sp. TaxID=2291710 RepID=UPI0032660387